MRTLVRVLAIGFAAVLILLAAAAVIGAISARTVARNSSSLVMDQLVITRLLDEVEREQQVLNTAFYRLSRTPEMVDRARVLLDLDKTDTDIDQLVAQAASTPDAAQWQDLHRTTLGFSSEARRLLTLTELPEASSRDLFRRHEEVTAVVAKLVDLSYARAISNQRAVDARVSELAVESTALIGGCFAIALLCAALTVRVAARLFRQMEGQAGELSRVSFRMLEIQESVARRFAHELHDELGGSLTAIKTNLTALAALPSLNDPADRARLDDCNHLVETSISNVRELSQLLRPTILDDFGLDAAIRYLVDHFRERTRIDVDYRSTFSGRLPDETETHLFRIVQEALTNIARHSNATKVTVFLRADDGHVRLTLTDNGRGLSADARKGMGLSGMRARARSAGGELALDSHPGQGLTIEVWAPRTPLPAPAK